jgi:hypothetical protein
LALEELSHKSFNTEKAAEEKAYICKKLGIHINDFNIIMNLPAKIYRDYPNDEKKLDFIYSIYKLLNRSL